MRNKLLLLTLVLAVGTCCNAQTKNLWATATEGGVHGHGTLVKGDADGQNFKVAFAFDSTHGSYPIGKMAMADNGLIYCVTEYGGYADSCVICSYDPATDSVVDVYDFFLDLAKGGEPSSGLIKAANGLLYGTTAAAGAHGRGVLYSVDPVTNTYTDVHDFDGPGVSPPYIFGPMAELMQAADGKLYGLTAVATDSSDEEWLYSFDPATNQYFNLYSLGYANFSNFSLIPGMVAGPGNKIYGAYATEANLGQGVEPGYLFSFDIVTNQFAKLHHFTNDQGLPQGGLVVANGKVYGETIGANLVHNGYIYSYGISDTTFTSLAAFDSATGVYPVGGLGMLGNGKLMGSCMRGGSNDNGTLFTFDMLSNTFTKLMDFDSVSTGAYPMGDILQTESPGTGIATVATSEISVYPNPATRTLYVQHAKPNTPYTISNIAGQVINRGILNSSTQQIDVSKLPAGMYVINGQSFIKR
jgi:uncharacterized repeat protein (TIGR03803 family)